MKIEPANVKPSMIMVESEYNQLSDCFSLAKYFVSEISDLVVSCGSFGNISANIAIGAILIKMD